MERLTARIETGNAPKYLQQLFKHWSHRFETEFTPGSGRLAFSETDTLDATATEQALELTVSADSAERAAELAQVVEDHLRRFAFRETLDISWQ